LDSTGDEKKGFRWKRTRHSQRSKQSVNEKPNCPGKGMIIISHPSNKDCDSLKQILKEGDIKVPYLLINT
jgi:hypothetical protein